MIGERLIRPSVTCVCLTTAARRAWLPQAIACFEAQTYPHRELLLVFSGPGTIVDLLPPDPCIRLLPCERWSLGMLRNLGAEAAHGELIAHWDDDDFSDPDRLAYQVAALDRGWKHRRAAVHGFHGMKFVERGSPKDSKEGPWWQFAGEPGYPLGTSLLYRRDYWQHSLFPAVASGEDGDFALRAGLQLLTEPDQMLMYATIHPDNTSARDVGNHNNWTPLPGFKWPHEAAA